MEPQAGFGSPLGIMKRFTVLLAFVVLTGSTAMAATDAKPERVVQVRGQEVVRIPATRARLTAMIETQAESPAAAQQTVRGQSRTVLEFLERSRVDRLQAGALSLQPIYDHRQRQAGIEPDGPPKIVGYRAQWTATFEVEAVRAGEIADGIVGAGAARIAGFEFTATDAELARAQQEAIRGAARRAREDGNAVLDALGYRSGEVVRVDINSTGPVQPFNRRGGEMMMAMAADAVGATAVAPGMIEVNGSVALEIAY